MPELPEVETVRRGLEPVMLGHRIVRADVRRADLRWPFPVRMAERLTGARVESLSRRSKYILAALDTGETLIVHLGMSGRILVSGRVQGGFHHDLRPHEAHDHVVLDIEGGARITFNDARRFGMMDLCPTQVVAGHRLLAGLGPEPLGNGFHEAHLVAAFADRRSPVKAALLDQSVVAGLGNIYVSEILHRAGISPLRAANRIASSRVGRLVSLTRDVLGEAIAAGGSSLRDFRHADGELGYFQHTFRVYDREGEPCPKDGCTGTVRRRVQSGRSSFWCPVCQR
jgi:formamidopyrimidine-DNA glycosylase